MTEHCDAEQGRAAAQAPLDAIRKPFQSKLSSPPDLYNIKKDGLPFLLHHYTTVDGLVGIANSNALWLSDARYMNDSSELRYAADLIDEVVKETYDKVTDKTILDLMPYHSGIANGFAYGARSFIACLCEAGDLLSQWRGYGVDTAPVSLGLSLLRMRQPGALPPRTQLRKVIYSRATQRMSVAWIVDAWFEVIQELLNQDNGPSPEQLLPYPAVWELQRALAEHHLCFKHPSFAEEKEWRLIKVVGAGGELRWLKNHHLKENTRAIQAHPEHVEPSISWKEAEAEGVNIRFRPSHMGLVPYVAVPLLDNEGDFNGRLPLRQVTQGPTAHPKLAADSLRMFLESKGFGPPTEVIPSSIPLRW